MVHLEYEDKLLCHTWPGTRHRVQGPAYWVLPRRPKQPGGHDMEVALRPYQDIPYTGNMRGEGMQQGFHGDHLEKYPERDVSFCLLRPLLVRFTTITTVLIRRTLL